MDLHVVTRIDGVLKQEGIDKNPAQAFVFAVEEIRREQMVVVLYASLKMRSLLTILARQLMLPELLGMTLDDVPEEYVPRRRDETIEEAVARAQGKYGAKLLEYLEVARIFL